MTSRGGEEEGRRKRSTSIFSLEVKPEGRKRRTKEQTVSLFPELLFPSQEINGSMMVLTQSIMSRSRVRVPEEEKRRERSAGRDGMGGKTTLFHSSSSSESF